MFYLPRCQRRKSEDAIYHIMVRSISEISLFEEDKDKDKYLSCIKEYQEIYNFKVYAYCIMPNHAHLIIDSNGADISKIMHSINLKYALSYNYSHNRHGHLFQDRFKSKIVHNENYLITLSAYIHNNPLKVKGYENQPEKYKYSSLKIYLGLEKDSSGLLDETYLMNILDLNVRKTRKNYLKLVSLCNEEKWNKEIEFQDEKTEYKSERRVLIRDFNPEDILEFIAKETQIDKLLFYIRYNKKSNVVKALAAIMMRSLCNFKIKDICNILGNITQSTVSRLCTLGINLISTNEEYKNLFDKLICQQVSLVP